MTNGIIPYEDGFAVKDFDSCKVLFEIGKISFPSYERAVEACSGKFYPPSYKPYLVTAGNLAASGKLKKEPDADVWENLVYADDYRGIFDGEKEEYHNVTSVDKGAATEREIAYIDALAATYESLRAMTEKK